MLLIHQTEACSKTLHSCRHAFAISEHGRPGHEDIGSRCHCQPGRFGVDPSVHLEIAGGIDSIDNAAHKADFRQSCMEKPLMAKAWVDRHHQHLVNLWKNLFE